MVSDNDFYLFNSVCQAYIYLLCASRENTVDIDRKQLNDSKSDDAQSKFSDRDRNIND